MTGGLLATLLLFTPVQTAETVPAGENMLHLDGGFALLRVDVPAVPVVPLLTGDLVIAHGLAEGVDLRGVYQTTLGLTHRLGPEARARVLHGDGWAIGARLFGATVQWLFFERVEGNTFVDDAPYLAFVDVAFGVEHATSRDTNLAVQLEVAIPTAPDDPFAVLGVYPRLTVGGSFAL